MAAVAADEDAPPLLDRTFWQNAELLEMAVTAEKVTVTLRLDRDVVQRFKESGPGYQSRMNAVLRAYAATRRP